MAKTSSPRRASSAASPSTCPASIPPSGMSLSATPCFRSGPLGASPCAIVGAPLRHRFDPRGELTCPGASGGACHHGAVLGEHLPHLASQHLRGEWLLDERGLPGQDPVPQDDVSSVDAH